MFTHVCGIFKEFQHISRSVYTLGEHIEENDVKILTKTISPWAIGTSWFTWDLEEGDIYSYHSWKPQQLTVTEESEL